MDVDLHHIDFEVENTQIGRWRYTGFYGCPERSRRRESWLKIKNLAARSNRPWCIVGDFNDLMHADEKRGGRAQPQYLLNGFVETISACQLIDLGFVGEKFTWERSRGASRWIQERLDRALATQDWINMFPQSEVHVLEVATSDHLPLFLQLNKKNLWQDILERINACCLKLSEWGGGLSQEYKQQLADYRVKLRRLRSRRDLHGIQQYNETRYHFLKLLERQETYWKQRSKQFWLQGGDQNTRFFHRNATVRKKNNCFERIQDEQGVWRENKDDIQNVIITYFTQLFTTAGMTSKLMDREKVKQITEEENVQLLSELTLEEVKEAVFSMHPEKSPGQDSLNPTFFQSFWSIIGLDVLAFCKKFLETGELPMEANRTVVCLVPKVKNPQNMSEIRPISLCNVLVRILSKVLSNRLKVCLSSLISNTQSAFVEGRLLTDNALIAFEINHYIKRQTQGKNGVAGFKIDISKAYDRLEWGFIQHMMEKFGFHATWVNRIMSLIQSVSYGFLHDGCVFGNVIPTRGLRQGDPISPYIYILCSEGLTSLLRRAEEVGILHGCTIARGAPTISHLLFADDCYFFFRANAVEADVLKRILNRYEGMSGQKINYTKSVLTCSPNTSPENRTQLCQILEVNVCQSPGKYLGMPMVVGRNKCTTFSFLSERVEKKLQGWQNQTISKAGKVILLKTAAQVIPNFWMNMFLIPSEITDRIEKSMNKFWWRNGGTNGCIRWMSWERLCTVKEDGGLGFKSLKSFNVAMLAKQAWRLINNTNPLVTDLMRARYYPESDFLNAKLGSNPSFVWRSILETQEVIKQGCRKRIGDGLTTKIWKVPWLLCPDNGFLTTEMPDELKSATVAGLMNEDRRGWDDEILQDLCNERDRDLIKQIPLTRLQRNDTWFWLFDEQGKFSVRSCYRRIRGESACVDRSFWTKLWKLKLPGKVINLMWRACRKCLPSAKALVEKGVQINTICSWCRMYEETDIHVLFQCSFAREVWDNTDLGSIIAVLHNDTVLEILRRAFQVSTNEQTLMIALLCWCIWQRRNSWVWNQVNMSPFGVKHKACNMLSDWRHTQQQLGAAQCQLQKAIRCWSKPEAGWIKINSDAACHMGSNKISVGCVVRDERGNFLRARSNVFQGNFQPREAEAVGLKEALSWVKDWRVHKCIFECDAKVLVDAMNGEGGATYFHLIVEECRDIIKHFKEVLVCFVHRSANMAAHKLAQVAYSMSGPMEWHYTAPTFLSCNLVSDV
ncbi:hypothetical protein AgCh_038904 [Apium graveolens]